LRAARQYFFRRRQRGAAIAVGHPHQHGARFRVSGSFLPSTCSAWAETFDCVRIEG
jgi:hypothetical protein